MNFFRIIDKKMNCNKFVRRKLDQTIKTIAKRIEIMYTAVLRQLLISVISTTADFFVGNRTKENIETHSIPVMHIITSKIKKGIFFL